MRRLVVLLTALIGLGAASSAQAGALTGVSVTASDMHAGALEVSYGVSLTVVTPLMAWRNGSSTPFPGSAGYVRIQGPASMAFSSYVGAYEVNGSLSTVEDAIVNPAGLGTNVVDVYMTADVAAGQTLRVTIARVTNPQEPDASAVTTVTTSADTSSAVPTPILARSASTVSAGGCTGTFGSLRLLRSLLIDVATIRCGRTRRDLAFNFEIGSYLPDVWLESGTLGPLRLRAGQHASIGTRAACQGTGAFRVRLTLERRSHGRTVVLGRSGWVYSTVSCPSVVSPPRR